MSFSILHISDLHFDSNESQSPDLLAEFLINDVREHYGSSAQRDSPSGGGRLPQPDICVLSGDLVATGTEYSKAERFLERLSDELFDGLREKIFIVPGNHDIDWEISSDCYQSIAYSNELDRGASDPSSMIRRKQVEDRIKLFKRKESIYGSRFRGYLDFSAKFYRGTRSYPLEGPHSYAIQKVSESPPVVLVGFNSNQYIDHLNSVPSVDRLAIANAGRQLREQYPEAGTIRIAVWHHGLRPEAHATDYLDQSVVETLALNGGFSMLLHGHLHRQQYDAFMTLGGTVLPVVGAGALGAGSHERPESVPYHYNLIVLNESQATIHSRKRLSARTGWSPDYDWGDSGQSYRDVPLPRRGRTSSKEYRPASKSVSSTQTNVEPTSAWPYALISTREWQDGAEAESSQTAAQKIIRSGATTVGIDNPAFLFGRFKDLFFIFQQVVGNRTNRCISGAQWVGKSAFLQSLAFPPIQRFLAERSGLENELNSTVWCYIDLRSLGKSDDVARSLLAEFCSAVGTKGPIDDMSRLSRELRSKGQRLIALLDHFDAVLIRDDLEAIFLNQLRAHSAEINVVYSMPTGSRIPRVGREKAYYFYAIGHTLDFFESELVTRAFLSQPLALAGIEISEEVLEKLVWQGGCHPFFLSFARLSYLESFERHEGRDQSRILQRTLRKFDREVPPLYDGLLRGLTSFHHTSLRAVLEASERRYDGTVSIDLDPLLLTREDGTSLPFSEHFRRYYLEYYLPAREAALSEGAG